MGKIYYSTNAFLAKIGKALKPFLLLTIRLLWGWMFFWAGKSKLDDIAPVIDYFGALQIPFPAFTAYAVALVECLGGIFLFFGLAARVVSIPLIIVMLGAFALAHQEAVFAFFSDQQGLIQQPPFTFLGAALLVFVFGPGRFSLDGLLLKEER